MKTILKKLEQNPETAVAKKFFVKMLIITTISMIFMQIFVEHKIEIFYVLAFFTTILGCDYVITKDRKIEKEKRKQKKIFYENKNFFDEIKKDSWKKINKENNTGNVVDALSTEGVDFVLLMKINEIFKKFEN